MWFCLFLFVVVFGFAGTRASGWFLRLVFCFGLCGNVVRVCY